MCILCSILISQALHLLGSSSITHARHYFSLPTTASIIPLNSFTSILLTCFYPYFALPKNCIFEKVMQRHIFSCCESLECPWSNLPAGRTCFAGKENVQLADAPEHYNQQYSVSVVSASPPGSSSALLSLFSQPFKLFVFLPR